MSMTVLYVYSQTTFKTDVRIESMSGKLFNAGAIALEPGVYRLADGGHATAIPGANGVVGEYESVQHDVKYEANGTKTSYPDPPQRAAIQIGGDKIKGFLQGQGTRTTL